jgi:hypothetical protein
MLTAEFTFGKPRDSLRLKPPGSSCFSVLAGFPALYVLSNQSNSALSRQSHTGPFFLRYELRVADHFGAGINTAMLRLTWLDGVFVDYNAYQVSLRGNIHFLENREYADVFLGAGIGANIVRVYVNGQPVVTQGSKSLAYANYSVNFSGGARVYPLRHFGFSIEAGWEASAIFMGGLVLRL